LPTLTDVLLKGGTSALLPGLWVRVTNNLTGISYTSIAVTDLNGDFTSTAPAGDYKLYTSPDLATFTLVNSHYQIAPTNLRLFNPQDEGGVGDGIADDTQALIRTISRMPLVGSTLYLPPGTSWLISSQVLYNAMTDITVWGFGASLVLKAQVNWGTVGFQYGFLFQDCTNPKVLGLRVEGNGAAIKALVSVGWFMPIGFISSVVNIRSTTVKSFNAWVEDCEFNNIRSFGVGFRLVDGCHVNRCRGVNLYNDANVGGTAAFVVGARVSNFSVSDDCDFDGSNSLTGAIGCVVSPGNGGLGGTAIFDPAINFCEVLNYIQPAFFTAPAAAQATSTVQVAYGLIANPAAAPVTADGGAGVLPAGTYQLTYTLLNLTGETLASPASIGLVLGANRQIAVTSLAGLPNGVYAVKVYITAPAGQAGFALQVPVVANATGAFNVNNVGNGIVSPAANSTLAIETDAAPTYVTNDWFFLCQTPGSGANAGIVPADSVKVTAVDQLNKLVTFQRFDGSEGAGAAMNWAGQKVWTYSINTKKFCRDINVSESSFKNFGVQGGGAAGGVFLLGCLDFTIEGNRGWLCSDIIWDAEHCMRGSIQGNTSDNPGGNTDIAILFFIQDVSVKGNIVGRATQGLLFYSGWAVAGNILIDGNVSKGKNGFQLQPASGQTWDNVVEGIRFSNNTMRAGSNFGGVIDTGNFAIMVGKNPTGPNDLGGYIRDVTIHGNRFQSSSQRAVQFQGVDGMTITDNESSDTGYDFIGESNTFNKSQRIFVDGNILNNTGYRFFGGMGLYRSDVAPAAGEAPRIGSRNQWRNVDPTLNGTQRWYAPAGVAAHPTGPDNLLLGSLWFKIAAGVLQTSADTTTGVDGTWANIADALGLNGAKWTIPSAGASIVPSAAGNTNLTLGPVPGGGSGNVILNLSGKNAGVASLAFLLADYNSDLIYDVPTGMFHKWTQNGTLTQLMLLDSAGNLAPRARVYPGDQAFGQNTTGGILHAIGVPSNANGSNNDFCISDNGNVYFRATGVWGVVAHASITAQSTPANPALTASLVGVMMGLAGAITPSSTGKILVMLSGDMFNSVINDGVNVQLRYGTGGAPVNGAALVGTTAGGQPRYTAAVAAQPVPFAIQAIISGLTLGTAYWLDAAVAAITGGNASIENLSLSAVEV
jgi:hypothetical protein